MFIPLGCARCGCRQVTKVMRRDKSLGSGSVFLCVECGTPVPERPRPGGRSRPWITMATVMGLVTLLVLTFGITLVDTVIHPMDEPVGEKREASVE